MALQIAPIKASRRKILPSLNVSRYEATTDALGRTTYKAKRPPIKSERKKRLVIGEHGNKTGRISLENKELAKRTARRRQQGSAIPKDRLDGWANRPASASGESLKKGIIGMAKRAGIANAELFRKLNAADPAKLQEMYDKDELIFDVAFTYNEDGSFGDKEGDLDYLISVYEEKYGAL